MHFNNLIGRPSFTIPYMGYMVNYIQNPPGRYIAIAAAAVILLLIFIPDLFDDSKKKSRSKVKSAGIDTDSISGGRYPDSAPSISQQEREQETMEDKEM